MRRKYWHSMRGCWGWHFNRTVITYWTDNQWILQLSHVIFIYIFISAALLRHEWTQRGKQRNIDKSDKKGRERATNCEINQYYILYSIKKWFYLLNMLQMYLFIPFHSFAQPMIQFEMRLLYEFTMMLVMPTEKMRYNTQIEICHFGIVPICNRS